MTDSEWIILLKKSPRSAYTALIEQYGNLVYAIVINKIKNVASREDIEDCVSDVFVEVFQNAEKFSLENGSLKDYLSIIAKRTAIDAYRRLSNKRKRLFSIDDDEINIPAVSETPESKTEQTMFKQYLWDTVRSLGEPDSLILIYQYFYACSVNEIAQILSMTAAAVQKRSLRARKKIKQIITGELNS